MLTSAAGCMHDELWWGRTRKVSNLPPMHQIKWVGDCQHMGLLL